MVVVKPFESRVLLLSQPHLGQISDKTFPLFIKEVDRLESGFDGGPAETRMHRAYCFFSFQIPLCTRGFSGING